MLRYASEGKNSGKKHSTDSLVEQATVSSVLNTVTRNGPDMGLCRSTE